MKSRKISRFILPLLLAALTIPTACDEKESGLGINLQDPSTLYDGVRDTADNIVAYTVFDDSLITSGYSSAMIGNFNSPTYGMAEAIYYTQVSAPTSGGVNFTGEFHIDSIIMQYAVSKIYSFDGSDNVNLHFVVNQLDEQLMNDSTYYAFNHINTRPGTLYNETRSYSTSDTLISLKLNSHAMDIFSVSASNNEDFQSQIKGLQIRMVNDSDPSAITLDLGASKTAMTVYYHRGNSTTDTARYELVTNYSTGHFNEFTHTFTTPLSGFANNNVANDTIKSNDKLYLTPMAGTNIYLRMDSVLAQFHRAHPYAVIHYAELTLPLDSDAENDHPEQIYAYRTAASGYRAPIQDLLDNELIPGFDGKYDASRNCYRLRISRHFQQLLRVQQDYGTVLVLNSRRSSALSTVIDRTKIKLAFVYTDPK